MSAVTETELPPEALEARARSLLDAMSMEEKVGQLQMVQSGGGHIPDWLRDAIRAGRVGAIINEVDVDTNNELQRLATQESRHGIPLLVGRDVIHGFKTVFPIPLGQGATWDAGIVERGARISALEAAATGVNWTFAPMVDIGRDPRWGRVAEGYGEDPFLTGVLGAAAVRGYQGDDLAAKGSIAACAKHFAGYGASEAGRDYNTTNIPENELRNVHLPPFHAAIKAGCATVMTSFSDIDGTPASANEFLLRQVLRDEWDFDGMVVSDWDSVRQLAIHGLTADDRGSALAAARAGVDMEMTSTCYADHLASLVENAALSAETLDALVLNVLRLKLRLGLFDRAETDASAYPPAGAESHLRAAYDAAVASVVLLKNAGGALPLQPSRLRRVAVIGPLADSPHEQLGTWIFDGDPNLSVPFLPALRERLGPDIAVEHVEGLPTTRSQDRDGFADAVAAADRSDVAILMLGEEAILSGEAHCRADISLPGAQEALIAAIAETGTPVVLIVMAGRALALSPVVPQVHALLYAFHPGTMGGPALADLLLGEAEPRGRLPVSLPRVTGQIPIYYAHKRTGKPATPDTIIRMEDIPARATQLSVGNTSFHLDVHPSPLFPFGFGLSYSHVQYDDIRADTTSLQRDGSITLRADITNSGPRDVHEVVQLYVRDPVASVTRPMRQLVGFQHVRLHPGERRSVAFTLRAEDLAFAGRDGRWVTEPGRFQAWIGGDATAALGLDFTLHD